MRSPIKGISRGAGEGQHGFYAKALRAHLRSLATIAGLGTLSCTSGIVRFVQGGVVKTFRWRTSAIMSATAIGTAELLLITDCTVGDDHFAWIGKLAGRGIAREQVGLVGAGRSCTWPLELDVPSYTSIDSVGSHVWHLAGYLSQNRNAVHAIQNLGCNLQLNVYGVVLDAPLTLPASTLQQLGELNIQLQLLP